MNGRMSSTQLCILIPNQCESKWERTCLLHMAYICMILCCCCCASMPSRTRSTKKYAFMCGCFAPWWIPSYYEKHPMNASSSPTKPRFLGYIYCIPAQISTNHHLETRNDLHIVYLFHSQSHALLLQHPCVQSQLFQSIRKNRSQYPKKSWNWPPKWDVNWMSYTPYIIHCFFFCAVVKHGISNRGGSSNNRNLWHPYI